MQPYQQADEEIKMQSEAPLGLAKKGLSVAGTLAGGAVIGRALPLLNNLIPADLAIKGLSKIDPRFGTFIDTALKNGKSFDEVKDFIKDKITPSEPAKENRSIIEQYSPELHQFIMGEIQKGRSPLEAGALAQSQTGFKKVIAQMSKDHKIPFSAILESTFGGGQMAQQPQSKAAVQPQQAQGGTNSDQALLAALEKILTM